jgi:LmbE family N-acetylglucosaminyl deacetylase
MAGTPKVYLNTINKDLARRSIADAVAAGVELPGGGPDGEFELGVSEDRITTTVDVAEFVDLKRKAMAAHASQISESSFFLAMPPEMFGRAFGQEWYILCDAPPGTVESDVFAGLPDGLPG